MKKLVNNALVELDSAEIAEYNAKKGPGALDLWQQVMIESDKTMTRQLEDLITDMGGVLALKTKQLIDAYNYKIQLRNSRP